MLARCRTTSGLATLWYGFRTKRWLSRQLRWANIAYNTVTVAQFGAVF